MRTHRLAPLLVALSFASCASTRSAEPDGWTQLELRDYAGALQTFERVSAPTANTLAGRARALFLLGRLAEAEAGYRAALEQEPAEPQWHIGTSLVRIAAGDTEGAIQACDAALTINPRLDKAYYNRAFAHDRANRPEAALADYTRALQLTPVFADAYNSRGVVLARMGRHREALADFGAALRISTLAGAHSNRAASHYALGEVEQALVDLNAAIKLERSRPGHLVQRGRIYLDLGRPALAEEDFSLALALDPSDDRAAILLARARRLRTSLE